MAYNNKESIVLVVDSDENTLQEVLTSDLINFNSGISVSGDLNVYTPSGTNYNLKINDIPIIQVTPSGDTIFNNNVILNVSTPISGNSAVNKDYVDSLHLQSISGVVLTSTDQTVSGVKFFTDKIGIGGGYLTGNNLLQVNAAGNIPTSIAGVTSILELDSEDPNKSDLQYRLSSNMAGAPALILSRSRGTLSTPTAVTSGDWNGAVICMSYNGTTWGNAAEIDFYNEGASGTPGRIDLKTTPIGSTSSTTRVSIKSDGTTQFLGPVLLDRDPTLSGQSATKYYVDLLHLQSMSGVVLTSTDQTISGVKTFADNTLISGSLTSGNILTLYGNDDTDLGNGLVIDGPTTSDKKIEFCDNGSASWENYIYKDEQAEFLYWYNYESDTDIVVLSENGRVGINKSSNLLDYHNYYSAEGGIKSITVASGGTNYLVGNVLTIVRSTDSFIPALLTVTATGVSGSVTAVSITNPGEMLFIDSNRTVSGGNGTGAQFNITDTFNSQMDASGTYTEEYKLFFKVTISQLGSPDKFSYTTSLDALTWGTEHGGDTNVSITGTHLLSHGVYVSFATTTGNTLNAYYIITGYGQLPESNLQVSPQSFNEVLTTSDYSVSGAIYQDITYRASSQGIGESILTDFIAFNSGSSTSALYVGKQSDFSSIFFHIEHSGNPAGTAILEYWNGTAWSSVSSKATRYVDGTKVGSDSFQRHSGVISWSKLSLNDWVPTYPPNHIEDGYNLYWIRIRLPNVLTTSYVARAINPSNNRIFSIFNNHLSIYPIMFTDSIGHSYFGDSQNMEDSSGSLLHIEGSLGQKLTYVTTNTTLGADAGVTLCNNLIGTTISITLPDATQCRGRLYYIKNINAGKATILPVLSQHINGAASLSLDTMGLSYELVSDGSGWVTSLEARTPRTNYVLVNVVSDFPIPVNNVITLTPGYTYELNDNIQMGDTRIVLSSGNIIFSSNRNVHGLTYTGTSNLLTYTGIEDITLQDFNLDCTASGSQGLYINGIAHISGSLISLENLNIGNRTACYAVATIENVQQLNIKDCRIHNTYSGINISDSAFINIQDSEWGPTYDGCKHINMVSGSSYINIDINHNKFSLYNNQIALNIPQVSPLGGASIVNNIFSPFPAQTGYSALSGGLTHSNVYWSIKSNFGLRDHRILGLVKFASNASATTCSNINNYYKAAGTNATAYASERMNASTNNRITNLGIVTRNYNIYCDGAISCGSGSQTARIAIYKNGNTLVAETEVRIRDASQSVGFSLNDTIDLATNEYLEVFVRNTSATNNLTVEFMQFKVEE